MNAVILVNSVIKVKGTPAEQEPVGRGIESFATLLVQKKAVDLPIEDVPYPLARMTLAR
jgi:hypothetical protein